MYSYNFLNHYKNNFQLMRNSVLNFQFFNFFDWTKTFFIDIYLN